LKVRVDYSICKGIVVLPQKIVELVKEIVKTEGRELGEIGIILVDPDEILRINRLYLKHNYFTDVITFDNSKRKVVFGELYICPSVVVENAGRYFSTRHQELLRVIIHGVLHLLGYDDKTEAQQLEMIRRENFYLEMARRIGLEESYEFEI
jgi:rRNA maturation RNase YbeY